MVLILVATTATHAKTNTVKKARYSHKVTSTNMVAEIAAASDACPVMVAPEVAVPEIDDSKVMVRVAQYVTGTDRGSYLGRMSGEIDRLNRLLVDKTLNPISRRELEARLELVTEKYLQAAKQWGYID